MYEEGVKDRSKVRESSSEMREECRIFMVPTYVADGVFCCTMRALHTRAFNVCAFHAMKSAHHSKHMH